MRRLYTRLVVAFLLVILVTLCVLSATLFLILRRSPLEDRQTFTRLTAQALGIATFLQNVPNPPATMQGWEALLTKTAERQTVRIAWINPQGVVIFDSQVRWRNRQIDEIFEDRKRQTGGGWLGTVYEGDQRWLAISVPWRPDSDRRNELLVATAQPRFPTLQRFRTTLLTPLVQAGTVALILSIVVALLISRSIARPLHRVAEAARRMAQGDLSARATPAGPEEIQALARAFNEMGEKVQSSQQAQRDLVANVAHDLRTPLTSVQGFAQALVDGTAATPEAQAQAAQAIHEEARRMRRMTDTLLELARFEAGDLTLEREPVDLAPLVRKRSAHYRHLGEEAGLNLVVEASHPVPIMGNAVRLTQVLDNLVNNAVRHTPRDGRIVINVRAVDQQAELTVADTGEGIPKEELPRIFERFYRGDRARGGASTGLGLAIVREIVHAHDGTIDVESVEGIGTKFTVQLPCQVDDVP